MNRVWELLIVLAIVVILLNALTDAIVPLMPYAIIAVVVFFAARFAWSYLRRF